MIARARLRPGKGFQAHRTLFYFAQRIVPHYGLRRRIADAIALGVRTTHRHADPSTDPTSAMALATLRRSGLLMLPELVAHAEAVAMRTYFTPLPAITHGRVPAPIAQLPHGFGAAAYTLPTILDCPGLLRLLNAAPVLDLATSYLGCKPTLSSVGVRWSFPDCTQPEPTQHLHRDPDDWRFLKLFIYLTDVDPESGPHRYVLGSHCTSGHLRDVHYTAAAVAQRFGPGAMHEVTGRSGTAFIADTYGIHAGAVPTRNPRLILQAQYSLLPVYAFRYEPVPMAEAPPHDRYINRLLCRVGEA